MYKIFNSNWESPLQGGKPVCNGVLPFTLPTTELDISYIKCGKGWNYCNSLSDAITIAGLWTNGYPNIAVKVTPSNDFVTRRNKSRASSLTLDRLVTEEEWKEGITEFSKAFGELQEFMVEEQLLWWK